MKKKSLIITLLLLTFGLSTFPAYADDQAAATQTGTTSISDPFDNDFFSDQQPSSNANLGLSFGTTQVNGEHYLNLALSPEFNFGKLGMGLDLNLRREKDSGIRSDKIFVRYLSWGSKGDKPLYFRAGNIANASIGSGSIVDHYSNISNDDIKNNRRPVGLQFDVNLEKWGVESIVNNISDTSFYAARAYLSPLKIFPVKTSGINVLKYIDNLQVGATYAADTNSSTDTRIYGVDAELPVVPQLVNVYSYYNKIVDHGDALAAGVRGEKTLTLLDSSFYYRFEYRNMDNEYIPGYFNWNYESRRADSIAKGTAITDWKSYKAASGLYGRGGLNLFGQKIKTGVTYENYGGNPNMITQLYLSNNLFRPMTGQNISIGFALYQNNFENPWQFKSETSTLLQKTTWDINDRLTLISNYRLTYEKAGNGDLTPVETASIETKVKF